MTTVRCHDSGTAWRHSTRIYRWRKRDVVPRRHRRVSFHVRRHSDRNRRRHRQRDRTLRPGSVTRAGFH